MRPVVGIPVSLDARGRLRRGRATLFSDRAYARAVAACGGAPVLLPTDAPERAADVIAHVDALLLPGGDDFPPARARADYPDGVFDLADPEQVAFDAALLRAALAAAMPTLGICYGMQLMALEAGGALHAHLPVDAPSEVAHGGGGAPPAVHAIAIEVASRLARAAGADAARVESRHHQGVADPGRWRVAARAPDGLIEAIEAPDAPFAIGVQWHPEGLAGEADGALLRAFVAAAAERAASARGARPRGAAR